MIIITGGEKMTVDFTKQKCGPKEWIIHVHYE